MIAVFCSVTVSYHVAPYGSLVPFGRVPRRVATMTTWHEAGLGGPTPSVFSDKNVQVQISRKESIVVDPALTAPTETAAALIGAVACAICGYGLSAAQVSRHTCDDCTPCVSQG